MFSDYSSEKFTFADYENTFRFFKQVIATGGYTNIPSYEKLKRCVDILIKKEVTNS